MVALEKWGWIYILRRLSGVLNTETDLHLPKVEVAGSSPSSAPGAGVESNKWSRNGHPMRPWWPRCEAAEFEVREQWGRGEMRYAQ